MSDWIAFVMAKGTSFFPEKLTILVRFREKLSD